MDGQHEVMNTRYVLALSANKEWMKQLAALQGHVVPQRVELGIYHRDEDVSNRKLSARFGREILLESAQQALTLSRIELHTHHALPDLLLKLMIDAHRTQESRLVSTGIRSQSYFPLLRQDTSGPKETKVRVQILGWQSIFIGSAWMSPLKNDDCYRYTFLMPWCQDLFGSGGSMRDGAGRVGLNMLTKALAKCVVGAHETYIGKEGAARDTQAQRLHMDLMQVQYTIDHRGDLWFSHSVRVQLVPNFRGYKAGSPASQCANRNEPSSGLTALDISRVLQPATTGIAEDSSVDGTKRR